MLLVASWSMIAAKEEGRNQGYTCLLYILLGPNVGGGMDLSPRRGVPSINCCEGGDVRGRSTRQPAVGNQHGRDGLLTRGRAKQQPTGYPHSVVFQLW